MKIVSFFAGCGGLDLGFEQAGYDVIWANEFDKRILPTYRANHSNTYLDSRSITEISPEDIPDCDGIIGGPPCQSWSMAGLRKGICDPRGQLFYPYINLIKSKRPAFFLAENVRGIIDKTHKADFDHFIELFKDAGYAVQYKLLWACDYGVPQTRPRVIIVGVRKDIDWKYRYPDPVPENERKNVRDAIGDIRMCFPYCDPSIRVHSYPLDNLEAKVYTPPTHTYKMYWKFDEWDKPSYTILTRSTTQPWHPNKKRRLSVRECARIQTFPDNFQFIYECPDLGYHMIGNAVPVLLAKTIATSLLPIADHIQ